MLSPREALITLNLLPRLGSIRIQALLEFFGSAELALHAPKNMLAQVPRIGANLAEIITSWRDCTNVHAELECAECHGVRVITLLDDDYPSVLRRMADPPIVLYCRGEWKESDAERSVALVGTRQATAYGISAARHFGRALAERGCTIISGLARGIDTAAHFGALDAGGRTLAVLGFGMAEFYPSENRELADQICAGHGALISEFPMLMRPSRTTFPQRNRIVAAWSRATVVVEAPLRSGALHTASMAAADYGNSIFAIPGPINRHSSDGCHALIRDGAILCTTPEELLQDMQWTREPRQMELFEEAEKTPASSAAAEPIIPEGTGILKAIQAGHDTLDALCSALGMPSYELSPLLLRLQIAHQIVPLPGARFACCR